MRSLSREHNPTQNRSSPILPGVKVAVSRRRSSPIIAVEARRFSPFSSLILAVEEAVVLAVAISLHRSCDGRVASPSNAPFCSSISLPRSREGRVTALSGVLNLQGSVKTTKLKLAWIPDTNELVNLTLTEFDYLITKKKLEDDDEGADFVNPNTKKETLAPGDSNMRNLKCGDVIQLERKDYFRCDVPFVKSSKPIVLFSIPDGRAAK